jgi:hypothetical protein
MRQDNKKSKKIENNKADELDSILFRRRINVPKEKRQTWEIHCGI